MVTVNQLLAFCLLVWAPFAGSLVANRHHVNGWIGAAMGLTGAVALLLGCLLAICVHDCFDKTPNRKGIPGRGVLIIVALFASSLGGSLILARIVFAA